MKNGVQARNTQERWFPFVRKRYAETRYSMDHHPNDDHTANNKILGGEGSLSLEDTQNFHQNRQTISSEKRNYQSVVAVLPCYLECKC